MPNLVICPCQNCSGKIQFDPATLSNENKEITCPHCSLTTILFVPPSVTSPLINCPACNSGISRAAASCPRCGHPIRVRRKYTKRIIEIVGAISLIGIALAFAIAGSSKWRNEILQGAKDRDAWKQSDNELANTLRNLQLNAANAAAIHAKQLANSDAEHESARKIKVAEDAAKNHAEATAHIEKAQEDLVVSELRLAVVMGLISPELGDAEIAKSFELAQALLSIDTKSSLEIKHDLLVEYLLDKQDELRMSPRFKKIMEEVKKDNQIVRQGPAEINRKVMERLAQEGWACFEKTYRESGAFS